MSKVRSAIFWDFGGSIVRQVFTFAIFVVLARLLSPTEFGVIAIGMVFVNTFQVFIDFGISASVIQDQREDDKVYSSLFFVNIVSGFLIALLVYSSSGFISGFFDINNLKSVIQLLSIGFVFISLNLIQTAILRKHLRMRELTLRSIIASTISGGIAISAALMGFGVHSLVIQFLLNQAINSILLWRISDWQPRWYFSYSLIKDNIAFSIYLFFASALNQIIREVDTLLLGKYVTISTVGNFNRSKALENVIGRNISRSLIQVYFPVLSGLQEDKKKFKRELLKILSIITFVSCCITLSLYFITELLIINLYGGQWAAMVPIFELILLQVYAFPLGGIMTKALLSMGLSKENFWLGNIDKFLYLVCLSFIILFNFQVFLYGYIATSILGTIVNCYGLNRYLGIELKALFSSIWSYIIIMYLLLLLGYGFIVVYNLPGFLVSGILLTVFIIITSLSKMHAPKFLFDEFKKISSRFFK